MLRAAAGAAGALAALLAAGVGLVGAQGGHDGWAWRQEGSDIDGEAVGDRSGAAVAVNGAGNVVAIGAIRNKNDSGENAGHVRVYRFETESGQWRQVGSDIDGESGHDRSGSSVALSGAWGSQLTLAVGAFRNDPDDNLEDAGHVRVFSFDSVTPDTSTWLQVGSDLDGTAPEGRFGQDLSLSSDGQRIVVGAPEHNGKTGLAKVFRLDSGLWEQLGSGVLSGDSPGDRFGSAVAISGDGSTVVVGGYGAADTDGNESAGFVRVFRLDSNDDWEVIGEFVGDENDELGRSLSSSIDGRIIAIGAPQKGKKRGFVQVKELAVPSGVWSDRGEKIFGTNDSDRAGEVSISGDGNLVLIGSRHHTGDNGLYRAGQARLFQYTGSSWAQRGQSVFGEYEGDKSGWAVRLNADADGSVQNDPQNAVCVVGAPYNDGSGTDRGHARVYEYDASNGLVQMGGDIDGESNNDSLTTDSAVYLSADGSTVAIGSSFKDGNGGKSGHVYVYLWDEKWTQKGDRIDGDLTGDRSGKSVALASSSGDVLAVGAFKHDNLGIENAGQVRVFIWSPSNGAWESRSQPLLGASAGQYFGYSVSMSLSGDVLAVGATHGGAVPPEKGELIIFGWNSSTNQWEEKATKSDLSAAQGDEFGKSVAVSSNGEYVAASSKNKVLIYAKDLGQDTWGLFDTLNDFSFDSTLSVSISSDGNVLAVGEPDAQNNAGVVKIYRVSDEGDAFIPDDTISGDLNSIGRLGESVSLSGNGDVLAIGVPDPYSTGEGEVRVYERSPSGDWTQRGSTISGEGAKDTFGSSVCLSDSGYTVAAAAPYNSDNGETSGSVMVFRFTEPGPSCNGDTSQPDCSTCPDKPLLVSGTCVASADCDGDTSQPDCSTCPDKPLLVNGICVPITPGDDGDGGGDGSGGDSGGDSGGGDSDGGDDNGGGDNVPEEEDSGGGDSGGGDSGGGDSGGGDETGGDSGGGDSGSGDDSGGGGNAPEEDDSGDGGGNGSGGDSGGGDSVGGPPISRPPPEELPGPTHPWPFPYPVPDPAPMPPEIPRTPEDAPAPERPLPAPSPPLPRVACEKFLIRRKRVVDRRACRRAGRLQAAFRQSPPLCLPVRRTCMPTTHNGGSCWSFPKKKKCLKAGCKWAEPFPEAPPPPQSPDRRRRGRRRRRGGQRRLRTCLPAL